MAYKKIIKRGRPKGSLNKSKTTVSKVGSKLIKQPKNETKKLDLDKAEAILKDSVLSETSEINTTEDRPQRDAKGKFIHGNTIARGIRNPYRKILNEISEADFNEMLVATVNKAKAGDYKSFDIICKYVMPPRSEPETVMGIKTKTAEDLAESMDIVIQEMADGSLSPEGGMSYLKCLSSKREFLQTAFLEDKINKMDERLKAAGK
jgi:hypothetical protein